MASLSLVDKHALVTGAGSGIGRSIALRLAAAGAHLYLVGRTAANLESVKQELAATRISVHAILCDLNTDNDVANIRHTVRRFSERLDILVHCAGTITLAPLQAVAVEDFDRHYRINVRAPLLLTQTLLPLITEARGQIVFINSSVGTRAKERVGAYAASKHALKALADTLRMEINPSGVRVLSIFPGDTATEMQRQLCREQDRPFVPEAMLQPDDVATAVVNALTLPPTAELTDLHIRPARPRA